jgi:hypothetical protein
MDYDSVILKVGGFGKYQKTFLFVFTAIKVDIIDNSEMLLKAKHL